MKKTIKIGKHYCISEKELGALNALTKTHSKAERDFHSKAIINGWTVLKGGWPDYLIVKGKSVAFVEVKSDTDRLRKEQIKMLDTLTTLGLDCFIWNPTNGFTKYEKAKSSSALKCPGALIALAERQ